MQSQKDYIKCTLGYLTSPTACSHSITHYIFPQLACFKCLCWSGRFPFHSYLVEVWAGRDSWSSSSVLAICYLQMQNTYLLKFRAAVFNDKMITSISFFSQELNHHHHLHEGKTVNWTESQAARGRTQNPRNWFCLQHLFRSAHEVSNP